MQKLSDTDACVAKCADGFYLEPLQEKATSVDSALSVVQSRDPNLDRVIPLKFQ